MAEAGAGDEGFAHLHCLVKAAEADSEDVDQGLHFDIGASAFDTPGSDTPGSDTPGSLPGPRPGGRTPCDPGPLVRAHRALEPEQEEEEESARPEPEPRWGYLVRRAASASQIPDQERTQPRPTPPRPPASSIQEGSC